MDVENGLLEKDLLPQEITIEKSSYEFAWLKMRISGNCLQVHKIACSRGPGDVPD